MWMHAWFLDFEMFPWISTQFVISIGVYGYMLIYCIFNRVLLHILSRLIYLIIDIDHEVYADIHFIKLITWHRKSG